MKKLISLMLALMLGLSLAACGGQGGDKNDGGSEPGSALELLTTVWSSYSDDEKFPAAGGDYENSVDDAPGAFDLSQPDNVTYLLALPEDDVALVDDAASLMHMMNGNTFTCGAFHAADADNVEGIASDLRDSIQGKQWMCGFPDKLVVFTLGQYVVSMYGAEDLIDNFKEKLQTAYPDGAVAYEENIL